MYAIKLPLSSLFALSGAVVWLSTLAAMVLS